MSCSKGIEKIVELDVKFIQLLNIDVLTGFVLDCPYVLKEAFKS